MRFFGAMRYGKHQPSCSPNCADSVQIEYLVVSFDDKERSVKLSLRQAEILEQLAKDEELLKQGGGVPDLAVGSCKYVSLERGH